jgi:hypothetical protein
LSTTTGTPARAVNFCAIYVSRRGILNVGEVDGADDVGFAEVGDVVVEGAADVTGTAVVGAADVTGADEVVGVEVAA